MSLELSWQEMDPRPMASLAKMMLINRPFRIHVVKRKGKTASIIIA
jgi:hypothetical protein